MSNPRPYGNGYSKKTHYKKFDPRDPNQRFNYQPLPPQEPTPAEREAKRLKLSISAPDEPRRDRNW